MGYVVSYVHAVLIFQKNLICMLERRLLFLTMPESYVLACINDFFRYHVAHALKVIFTANI